MLVVESLLDPFEVGTLDVPPLFRRGSEQHPDVNAGVSELVHAQKHRLIEERRPPHRILIQLHRLVGDYLDRAVEIGDIDVATGRRT